jgi:hypothetical protein
MFTFAPDVLSCPGAGAAGREVVLCDAARAVGCLAGGNLLLAAPRGPVQRILALTGLIDVFSLHASMEDAVRVARPVVTAG